MENNLFKEFRERKGIELREISDSIRGLSYKRICNFENDPKNTKIKVLELVKIFKILSLNENEERELLDWLGELHIGKE